MQPAAVSLLLPLALLLATAAADSGFNLDFNCEADAYVPLDKWLKQRDLHSCLGNSPADILFVLDASQSVGIQGFHLVAKSLLIDTISRLPISGELVQAGVIVFSDQVSQVIPIGKHRQKLQLLSAVSNLQYVGSFTALDVAVEGSLVELERRERVLNRTLTPQLRERRKRIVVFVTDGRANHGSAIFLHRLLTRLYQRVSGLIAIGLGSSNQETLQLLASDPTLVFNPTTYPDFQTALLKLVNVECADSCYRYREQDLKVHKIVSTQVQYTNLLVDNYVASRRQELDMLEYVAKIRASTAHVTKEINRTCGAGDDLLLQKIVDVQQKISRKTSENFTDFSVVSIVAELMQKSSSLRQESFEAARRLAVEKSRLTSAQLEAQQATADFEARLASRRQVRQANEESLRALQKQIAEYEAELLKLQSVAAARANASALLNAKVEKLEGENGQLMRRMQELTRTYSTLLAVKSGGNESLVKQARQIDFCRAYVATGETILYAFRCGTGIDLLTLFSRSEDTFDLDVFKGLSTRTPVYKSPYLRRMFTMGYFKEASLKFLIKDQVVATLTMDTSRYELLNIFSGLRVKSSYPWSKAYVGMKYRSSLRALGTQFFSIFGDLERFEASGSCSDLEGAFVILGSPHRCFPNVTSLPAVFISSSPYGGRFDRRIDEVQLVTRQLPTIKRLPTVTTTKDQLSEVILFLRRNAGALEPLLRTDRYFTSAADLANLDNVNQLHRHYKSAMLSKLNSANYEAVNVDLFDRRGKSLVQLRFTGPFTDAHATHGLFAEVGSLHAAYDWFASKSLQSAIPFNFGQMSGSQFEFQRGGRQFFTIGQNLTLPCEQRRYFVTVIDGGAGCDCFKGVGTPAILYSEGPEPSACEQLKQADNMRVTAYYNSPRL